jgi:hypothetical protein
VSSYLQRKIFLTIGLSFIIVVSLCTVPRYSFGVQQQAGSTTGVIVPLYSYPGSNWQSLIQAKETYPSVPVIAIINPSSGPGSYQDPNYVTGIEQLESADIAVIGYVATGYGSVPISQAEQEIYTYSQFYGLNGIFFDEMASVSGFESYYSTLNAYAASLGYSVTVGNPGQLIPASYIGTVDNIVIYENSGLPSTSFLSSLGYDPSDFSVISYSDSGVNASFVQAAAGTVGYIYVTDGSLPNPYAALSSYFITLMSTLAGTTGSGVVSNQPAEQTVTVNVDSVSLTGNQINGLWMTVQSGGQVIASGYTPFSFQASTSSTYNITIDNYANYVFDFWSTGSIGASLILTPSSNIGLTAFYLT